MEISELPFIAPSSDAAHRRRIEREKRGIASSTRPMAGNRRGTYQSHFGRCLDGPHAQQCSSGVSAHSGSLCSEHARAKREQAREKNQARGRRRKKGRETPTDGPRSYVSASKPMTFCVRPSLLQKSLSLVSPVICRKNYSQINFWDGPIPQCT